MIEKEIKTTHIRATIAINKVANISNRTKFTQPSLKKIKLQALKLLMFIVMQRPKPITHDTAPK